MRLFGFNFFGGKEVGVGQTKSYSEADLAWLKGEEVENGPLLTNAYEQVVWVYRAINVLAEQVANIPFLFSSGERGREHLITSGPLLDFYARPHPQINRFQYWELRIIWLMLRGECFRVPIYSVDGRKLEKVLILDPAHFQHIVSGHELVGWRYTGFGPRVPLASQVFLPEEVWFEKLPNPFDFWRGLPPLYAAASAAQTDFAAGAFMRGIIENNADSGVIVRTDKPLAPEQSQQLIARLRERKHRAGRADKPLLLSGVSEVIKPELSSSDLQFLENRKFSRAEICAAFGVPEEIVTTTDHNKYDVMQGARQNFIENRVAPLCGRLEAEEDVVVKSLDSRAVGWFDLDSHPIMQQARRNRLVTAKTGFDMGVPFNELNRVFDLGFKALPWGDNGYLGSGLQLVGQSPLRKLEVQAEKLKVEDPIARALGFFSETLETNRGRAGTLVRDEVAIIKAKARRYLFEQRGRVLAKLEAANTDKGELLEQVFDSAAEVKTLSEMIAPAVSESLRIGTSGLEGKRSVSQEKVDEVLPSRLSALREATDSFQSMLGFGLQLGLANGESREALSGRVKRMYNQNSERWAEQLALTEIEAARQNRSRT